MRYTKRKEELFTKLAWCQVTNLILHELNLLPLFTDPAFLPILNDIKDVDFDDTCVCAIESLSVHSLIKQIAYEVTSWQLDIYILKSIFSTSEVVFSNSTSLTLLAITLLLLSLL